ncbi:GTPase IMAP family member 4 isoform X2 [Labrus mixtus]|uniref:GTPase IMAP family member 4 isoform X2 n=1 Tax=Labrus mixtus TaxID=508554 RepID=UPI0029BFD1BD|nr:GTPase IMAP family member 4 isoform X2 [Labrus mixtus]
MCAAVSQPELRLVVLGRTGAGKRPAVSAILGLQDGEQGTEPSAILGLQDGEQGTEPKVIPECSKHRGEAAGRQVVVVSCPAWFGSDCDPKDRRRHISSFISLSAPGPHAFLLCVPVNQPADEEAKALDVLEELLGPAAVSTNTIVLFSHTEELEEDERLEEYLVTWRKDLRELARRCGDRYHTLETRGGDGDGDGEERRAVEELLEKVEEGGATHFTCRLYEEAEERVREKQAELVRKRRGEDGRASPTQENTTEEEMEAVRDEAERSVEDLDVDVESVFPSLSVSSPAQSFLWVWWEKLMGWVRRLPKLVRREALLGALVGLFVGGPFGGIMGATVGSVATEVVRRKSKKTK